MIAAVLATLRRGLRGFGRFSPGQKAATICTVLALAVGGTLFATWASRPTYAPLYSNLSGGDANAIVEKLSASGVRHKLADGGQTILVPQDQVYDLRLTMSGAGLPAGKDTGYALLDKQGVTTSEFMQHVGYQRALEGELANTINAINGVDNVTVHLALPQKDVFTEDTTKPTASVLVTTAPRQALSVGQVQAIVHLVSSSVVDLAPEEVTVADATGKVLSAGGVDSTVDSSGTGPAQQTQAFEQRMNASLQQMLDQVVGPGHAVVKVTAALDYDQTDTKSQTYVGTAKMPPLSETTHSETYTGTGAPNAAGVLGPDNIQVPTSATSTNAGGGNGKYAQSTVTRDNAVGVVTQTRRSAPGTVKRMSVAVLLDSTTAGKIDQAAIQKLVSSAAGLDTKRGDAVAVAALPFDESAAKAAKDALAAGTKAEGQARLISMVKQGLIVLAVLMLLFLARRAGKKRRRADSLTDEERLQLEEMQLALEEQRSRVLAGGGGGLRALAGGGHDPDDATSAEKAARAERQGDLLDLVERQPEEVAALLRTWLADKKG